MPEVSTAAPRRSSFGRRLLVRLVLSLAIGGGLGYLAFRGLRPGDLLEAFAQADYWLIAPFLLTLVGVQVFRSWRWRFLLEPLVEEPPRFGRIFVVSSVGFAAIMLLPLRLGELVRPYLISDPRDAPDESARDVARTGKGGARLRMSAALGTIAVERVVDGLIVSVFLFGSFLVLGRTPNAPGWMMPTAYSALAIFGGAAVFLVAGLWRPSLAVRLFLGLSGLSWLARRRGGRAARIRDRTEDLLRSLLGGFAALSQAGCLARFLGISFVYWVFNGLGFYVLAHAFHLDLGLIGAFAICGMVAIGIILPAGPGLVGNFHEFGRLGLQLSLPAAVIAGPGMAFIVLLHGLHTLWYVGIGLLALRSRHVRLSRVWAAAVAQGTEVEPEE